MPCTTVTTKAAAPPSRRRTGTPTSDNLNWLKEVSYAPFTSERDDHGHHGGSRADRRHGGRRHTTRPSLPDNRKFRTCRKVGRARYRLRPVRRSTQLGRLGSFGNNAAAVFEVSFDTTSRFTPTAASHTYSLKVWRENANGVVYAGVGAANDQYPASIRIVRGAHA